MNVSIICASQNNAIDVTLWRYSCFQAKILVPDFQFRYSLQCSYRKMFKRLTHLVACSMLSVLMVALLNASSMGNQWLNRYYRKCYSTRRLIYKYRMFCRQNFCRWWVFMSIIKWENHGSVSFESHQRHRAQTNLLSIQNIYYNQRI